MDAGTRKRYPSDLTDGQWQWSAWLSAQGRVRAFFRLLRSSGERIILILNGGSAAALQTALVPYVLRSKVRLHVQSQRALGYFEPAELREATGSVPQQQDFVETQSGIALAATGREPRWYVVENATAATAADDQPEALNRWRAADIAAGIVALDDTLRDRYLPAWIGLDRLGAVSVRKGCYPGQEIVARLHFKGGNKRWLHRVEFTAASLPAPGTALAAGADAQAGELLNAAWTSAGRGLALATLPNLGTDAVLTAAALHGAAFRVVSAVDRASD